MDLDDKIEAAAQAEREAKAGHREAIDTAFLDLYEAAIQAGYNNRSFADAWGSSRENIVQRVKAARARQTNREQAAS